MLYVVAKAKIQPEKLDEYMQIVKEIVPIVHGEEGCIRYEPCVNWSEDGSVAPEVVMMETWASKKHLDAHLASAHMKEFVEKVKPLRLGPSELMLLVPALP